MSNNTSVNLPNPAPQALRDKIKWIAENIENPNGGWNAVEMLEKIRELGWGNEWIDVIGVADEARALGYR